MDPTQELRQVLSEAGLPDDRLFMAMGAVLRAREAVVSRLSRALEPIGLSTSEFLLLVTLAMRRRGGLRLGRLANALLLHPTTVTQLVDALEARGMVERRPYPRDRRSVLAVLTESGWAHTRDAIAEAAKMQFGLADISPEGAGLVSRTLEPLGSGLWLSDPRK